MSGNKKGNVQACKQALKGMWPVTMAGISYHQQTDSLDLLRLLYFY